MSPNQSVFWPNSESTRAGAYVVTAVVNCAAFNMSGTLVTDDADMLVLYSNPLPGRPFPDLVVMSTTPLAAFAP